MKLKWQFVLMVFSFCFNAAADDIAYSSFECRVKFLQIGNGVYISLVSKPLSIRKFPSEVIKLNEKDFSPMVEPEQEQRGLHLMSNLVQTNLNKISAEINVDTISDSEFKPFGFVSAGRLSITDRNQKFYMRPYVSISGVFSEGSKSSVLSAISSPQVDITGRVDCVYKIEK